MQKNVTYTLCLLTLLMFFLFYLEVPSSYAWISRDNTLEFIIGDFTDDYQVDIFIYQAIPLKLEQIDLAHSFVSCDDPNLGESCYGDRYYRYPYPSSLITFRDKDGFVSSTLYGTDVTFSKNTVNNRFSLSMSTPAYIKIVLINDQDQKIISKILYINQYKDHITWSLSDVFFTSETLYDVGIIYGLELDSLHPPKPYLYMAISLILTLIIELSILLVFGFIKKHTFLVVALLNVLIQAILGLMVYFNIYQGRGPNFGILSMFLYAEVLILIIKVLTKTLFIKERTPIWSMTYAFVAGITSAIIGLIVIAHYVSNFINLP